MAEDPAAIVKRVFEPTAGLDRKVPEEDAVVREAMARASAEDIEFAFVGPAWQSVEGLPGSGRGIPELERAFEDWAEPFESYTFWPAEYAGKGDRVLALFDAKVVLAGQSTPFDHQHGLILTLRDGLIVRVELYLRAEDARAAFERL